MTYTVFVLLCSDDTYHSGITKQLDDRLTYHRGGKNPYTQNRLPIELAYQRSFEDLRDAKVFQTRLETYSLAEIRRFISGELEIVLTPSVGKDKQEKVTLDAPLILPAVYFGNLAYFETISNCSLLLLDGEERYEKQTFRSRCTLLSANGLQNLIVPVIRPNGKHTQMKDILISYAENWQKDHVKAIESAYRKAPFYDYYASELLSIVSTRHEKLIDLNLALTRVLIQRIGLTMQVEIAPSSQKSSIEAKQLAHPKTCPEPVKAPYHQLFSTGKFEPNLGLLDYLFNEGKPL